MPTLCIAGSYFHTEKQGGVETQILYIGQAMQRIGWRVVYLCPTNGKIGWQTDDENVGVYGFRQPNYGFQISATTIEKILQEINPDVVYQRGRSILQESGSVLQFCKRQGIPYVFGLSSDVDTQQFHGISRFSRTKRSIIKKIGIIPYGVWSDIKMQQTLRNADAIITQHHLQAERLPPLLRRKAVTLPNLHPEVPAPIIKSTEATVAWISNYRPLKRGELFLELAKRCSDLNTKFVMVVGNARHQYTAELHRQAAAIPSLQIFGACSHQQIHELLASSCMLINTSEYEGFSNVFIEAWLRETPTLSIGIDPAEALSKHQAGIPAKDFEELVQNTRYLLTHADECRQLGKQARIYGETNHGLQHNSHQIASFFLDMVSASRTT